MPANIQLLDEKIKEKGLTKRDILKKIKCSKSTYYRSIKSGHFSIGLAEQIAKAINLTEKEAIKIFLPNMSH